MSKATNKAQAFATLNTFADSRVALIAGMQKAGYATVEACKPVVIEWACGKTGAGAEGYKVNDKTGKVTMVSSHAKYESTKTVVRDVMLMLQGTTRHAESNGHQEEIEIPAEILKAAKALVKLCAEYEGARKIASTAVAQAFAK